MPTLKELTRPPDYEIRANIFIHHVRGVGMRLERKYAHGDLFELDVEKALEKWAERYLGLQSLLSSRNTKELGALAPLALADNLDRQSASSCEVEIHASCTSGKPLRELIEQTLELADRLQGTMNIDFMPLLSTDNEKGMITLLDTEAGESRFIFHVFFTFQ